MKRYSAEYYRSHGSTIRATTKSYYLKNREAQVHLQKEYRRKLRARCIEKLGGQCIHCSEREHAFLTFGHLKNGDGAKHRRELTGGTSQGGAEFYLRLLRGEMKRYPVQLECFNCNYAKTNVGGLRHEAIGAYGGECSCYGESRIGRLTLGHPDNNGGEHRRITHSVKTFYRHLKKTSFPHKPDGYRIEVQCWNCNLGAEANSGRCPHTERRSAD